MSNREPTRTAAMRGHTLDDSHLAAATALCAMPDSPMPPKSKAYPSPLGQSPFTKFNSSLSPVVDFKAMQSRDGAGSLATTPLHAGGVYPPNLHSAAAAAGGAHYTNSVRFTPGTYTLEPDSNSMPGFMSLSSSASPFMSSASNSSYAALLSLRTPSSYVQRLEFAEDDSSIPFSTALTNDNNHSQQSNSSFASGRSRIRICNGRILKSKITAGEGNSNYDYNSNAHPGALPTDIKIHSNTNSKAEPGGPDNLMESLLMGTHTHDHTTPGLTVRANMMCVSGMGPLTNKPVGYPGQSYCVSNSTDTSARNDKSAAPPNKAAVTAMSTASEARRSSIGSMNSAIKGDASEPQQNQKQQLPQQQQPQQKKYSATKQEMSPSPANSAVSSSGTPESKQIKSSTSVSANSRISRSNTPVPDGVSNQFTKHTANVKTKLTPVGSPSSTIPKQTTPKTYKYSNGATHSVGGMAVRPPFTTSKKKAYGSAHASPASQKGGPKTTSVSPAPGTKMIANSGAPNTPRNPCNCKKSRCLKLYCECFASGLYCSGCNCIDCFNTKSCQKVRGQAVRSVLDRNPNAFKPKIKGEAAAINAHVVDGVHLKGCHCKKSGCLKKYCECFQADVYCGRNCKCLSCKNFSGSVELSLKRATGSKRTSASAASLSRKASAAETAKAFSVGVPRGASSGPCEIGVKRPRPVDYNVDPLLYINKNNTNNNQINNNNSKRFAPNNTLPSAIHNQQTQLKPGSTSNTAAAKWQQQKQYQTNSTAMVEIGTGKRQLPAAYGPAATAAQNDQSFSLQAFGKGNAPLDRRMAVTILTYLDDSDLYKVSLVDKTLGPIAVSDSLWEL